jgi:redox-sensitive bicupin YhaK (pirin superfamily)
MKNVIGTYSAPRGHWVGDGFPVRSLFSYDTHGQHISPFLLLDYAGPAHFEPVNGGHRRGVGQHPHRGFETVTIVYQGEVDHRDSTGAGGHIGPGDVQWMTAAAGILHDEFHSEAFTRNGGDLEMVQLWVNLPARDKMGAPGYQTLLNTDIPVVSLPDGAGSLRVIAGSYGGSRGPAQTHTAMNVWDVRLAAGYAANFDLPPGHTLALVVLHGSLLVNGEQRVSEAQFALLQRDGSHFALEAAAVHNARDSAHDTADAVFLILSGEPIDEPIAGYGPFVMNTQAEINQAFEDFNAGKFGRMAR